MARKRVALDNPQARWRERNREKMNADQRARRAADPEGWRKRARDYSKKNPRPHKHIKRVLGLTDEDIQQLKQRCNNRCEICGVPGEDGKNKGALNVDHDHETNVVRGMLCFRCNYGLAYFKDDPQRLVAAVQYLQRTMKGEQ